MKTFDNAIPKMTMALVFVAILALPALADTVFEADMTGDQEVPASGSTAFGHATLFMNDAGTEIAYTVNFGGLDAPQTAAGFFMGDPGTVGTEIMTLPVGSPLAGIWTITPEMAEAMMNESIYVNIFSDAELFPNGEIRGNFTLTIVPNDAASLDEVKALYR